MTTKIQVRRDTSTNWTILNPGLSEGEIGFETNTGKFKIGNGSSAWSDLDYFLDSSDLSAYLTQASASTTYAKIFNPNLVGTVMVYGDLIVDDDITTPWVAMDDGGSVGYSRPIADNDTQSGSSTRRWTRVFAVNTTISSSDERDKLDINDSPLGLDFINDLRPVSYRWKVGEKKAIVDEEGNLILDEDGNKTYEIREGVRKHYGLISQEVKQALDNSGVDDFAGWVQDDLSDPDSHQSISYEQFIAPLIKSVQELSAKVAELEDK
jgi:hypothetical protein